MDLSGIAELFSTLTKDPTRALAAAIIIFFLLDKTGDGLGTAFRDIPKHLTEVIIATYNFILVLLHREQISYPADHDQTKNTGNKKDDGKEKSFKHKMISLLKKIKE